MTLTLGPLLVDADIDPANALVIRHAYVRKHEDSGLAGIHADSSDAQIIVHTQKKSVDTRRFPAVPAHYWVIFIKGGGDQARLWSVVENRGQVSSDGTRRVFDLAQSEHMADLRNRLVIGWRSPRTCWMNATTAATYPFFGIAGHTRTLPATHLTRTSVAAARRHVQLAVGG